MADTLDRMERQMVNKGAAHVEHVIDDVLGYMATHGWLRTTLQFNYISAIMLIAFSLTDSLNHSHYGRHVDEYPVPYPIAHLGIVPILWFWISSIMFHTGIRTWRLTKERGVFHEREHSDLQFFTMFQLIVGSVVSAVYFKDPTQTSVLLGLAALVTVTWSIIISGLSYFTHAINVPITAATKDK